MRCAALVAGTFLMACAGAAAGADFQVNTYTTAGQYLGWSPSVARGPGGRFMVVWTSRHDGDELGVFSQVFDADGTRRGSETRVNTYTTDIQVRPAVAGGASGFVVVWHSRGQDGSSFGIFGRRVDANGEPVGAEFQVHQRTTGDQRSPAVAAAAAGNFVVAWEGRSDADPSYGIIARRFDAAGAPIGGEFQVNVDTPYLQARPRIAMHGDGRFVVAWEAFDGLWLDVRARRFLADGTGAGVEATANTSTNGLQHAQDVGIDDAGGYVVVWQSLGHDGSLVELFGRRFDPAGTPVGGEFRVSTGQGRAPSVAVAADARFVVAYQTYDADSDIRARWFGADGSVAPEFRLNAHTPFEQTGPSVLLTGSHDLVAVWNSFAQDGHGAGIFGTLSADTIPVAMTVDAAAGPASDGNGVLEPGEAAQVQAAWRNVSAGVQALTGAITGFTGPSAPYAILDGAADYGSAPPGGNHACAASGDCYALSVGAVPVRPVPHWDGSAAEVLSNGVAFPWKVHLGESFRDVPRADGFYRFVETLLHRGVTGGCTALDYCGSSAVTREQMAAFVLLAKEGAGYAPRACVSPPFSDVPIASPFCRYVNELALRDIVAGCGFGNYCPGNPVAREQMAVFVLRTLDPSLNPPSCAMPTFADVPAGSPFCRWIEELARRGVVAGCGGGNYCPQASVTRAQMAVFLTATFGLTLYGP